MKCHICKEQEATTDINFGYLRLWICEGCIDKPDTLENVETGKTISIRQLIERYITIPLGQAITQWGKE